MKSVSCTVKHNCLERDAITSLAGSCLPILKSLLMHFIVPGFAGGKYVLPLVKSHVGNGCLVIARYREWTEPH